MVHPIDNSENISVNSTRSFTNTIKKESNMSFLVQVDFPYNGPFEEEMSDAMKGLAQDIATEPGLIWKIWTESKEHNMAGGIYLFDNKVDAERYLEKHEARLSSFGIVNIRSVIFKTNDTLSRIDRAPL
jgi:hypothetical protein